MIRVYFHKFRFDYAVFTPAHFVSSPHLLPYCKISPFSWSATCPISSDQLSLLLQPDPVHSQVM